MAEDFRASIVVDSDGAESVVRVEGELDLATAGELWAAVERAVGDGGRLVFDLSRVTFIDSSGLGVLIRAHQLLDGHGRLVVRAPLPQARRLFQSAGVDSMFAVEP
jgi:anti-sigma B factor antagonist